MQMADSPVNIPGSRPEPAYWQQGKNMARSVYDLQGYAVVLDKVVFVTRVFEAEGEEGFQFNVRFTGDLRLAPKYPTRHEADLQRELLLKAMREI
jgi:hypothetical protein